MAVRKASKKRTVAQAWQLKDCPVDAPPRAAWRPEWRDRATALLRAYNEGLLRNPARQAASRKGIWTVRGDAETTVECCYAVYVWARQHGIDPLLWARWTGGRVRSDADSVARLMSLFDAHLIPTYLEDPLVGVAAASAADAELHARLAAAGPRFVAGRDLHAGAETAKRNYRDRGHELLCIDAHDITFGFHPASTACLDCPLRDRCKAETAFRLSRSS